MADIVNAVSDGDEASPAAAAVVPEARSRWSKQDRQTLIITVAGTLAANLLTVMLVGAALAYVHREKTLGAHLVSGMLALAVTGAVLVIAGIVCLRLSRRADAWPSGDVWFGSALAQMAVGSMCLLVTMMTLIGVAAGVK